MLKLKRCHKRKNKMFVKFSRNKIYEIGHNPKTVTIKQICPNGKNQFFKVYKCIRRKNKLYCYYFIGKIIFIFNSLINAKKYEKIIQNYLK